METWRNSNLKLCLFPWCLTKIKNKCNFLNKCKINFVQFLSKDCSKIVQLSIVMESIKVCDIFVCCLKKKNCLKCICFQYPVQIQKCLQQIVDISWTPTLFFWEKRKLFLCRHTQIIIKEGVSPRIMNFYARVKKILKKLKKKARFVFIDSNWSIPEIICHRKVCDLHLFLT